MDMEMIYCTSDHLGSLLKIQICESRPWRFCFSESDVGPEICGDLNYFSFLITQYVNTFPPCKILKHYLISYDCIQLQAIKKKLNSCLSRWGLLFSWSKNPGSRQCRQEQPHQAPRQAPGVKQGTGACPSGLSSSRPRPSSSAVIFGTQTFRLFELLVSDRGMLTFHSIFVDSLFSPGNTVCFCFANTLYCFSWRRQWHPTPVFLPGKIPWTEEPGRL